MTQLRQVSVEDVLPTNALSELAEALAATGAARTPTPTFRPTSTPEPLTGPQFLDRVILTINVQQRAWTRIVIDGVVEYEGQSDPNTVLQYEAAQVIEILTGNGAGLRVTFNGQDIGALGERGEVVRRFFTTAGMQTPTPTPSPTPTNTLVPSPTPSMTPTSR
jgi:hypothetical protein